MKGADLLRRALSDPGGTQFILRLRVLCCRWLLSRRAACRLLVRRGAGSG